MNSIYTIYGRLLLAFVLGLMCLPAHAHLMKAQNGTLRLVGDNAYMVLSLPVSAFDGIDDNADGQLSLPEFEAHRLEIAGTLKKAVSLYNDGVRLPLRGLLLSTSAEEHALPVPEPQIVALGRFAITHPDGTLRFENTLFGKREAEQTLAFALSRKSDSQRESVTLTPAYPSVDVFPTASKRLLQAIQQGWYYLLLLLLVVLIAAWWWKKASHSRV